MSILSNLAISQLSSSLGIDSSTLTNARAVGASPPAVAKSDTPPWGIYDSGGKLYVKPDSFVSFDFAKDFRVPNYPIEGGGFETYNKVELPAELSVSMSVGGNVARKTAFISAMDALCASRDTYSIVTPDTTYDGVNMVRYDFSRTAGKGASLLVVTLHFTEVRLTAKVAFSNVKSASASANANQGSVQAQTPTPAQTPTGTPR